MNPYEVFGLYISLKNHFTKKSYDYHKYSGKTRTSLQSFYKRKDRFFFEKLSRKKTKEEIMNFFVANFVLCSDPSSLWIGDIVKDGEENYLKWKRTIQSLSYIFKNEIKLLLEEDFKSLFDCSRGHPILLRKYLRNEIHLETLVILNKIFSYVSKFDSKLQDPIWELVSIKICKYSSFLNIDVFAYRKILKEFLLDGAVTSC